MMRRWFFLVVIVSGAVAVVVNGICMFRLAYLPLNVQVRKSAYALGRCQRWSLYFSAVLSASGLLAARHESLRTKMWVVAPAVINAALLLVSYFLFIAALDAAHIT